MSLLAGVKDIIGRRKPQPKSSAEDRSWSDLGWEEKLSAMYRKYRMEERNSRIALNRLWFMTALYYQGKQAIEWNAQDNTIDIYERAGSEDWYTENQFRQDVWANVKSLNEGDREPMVAPASDKPRDITVARTANMALESIYDDIEFPRVKTDTNLSRCLFGNAFRFNAFTTRDDLPVIEVPKYKFEPVQLGGYAACPQCQTIGDAGQPACLNCGSPMEEVPMEEVESKVADGVDEQKQSRNTTIVTTPLEMYCRSKVRGGLRYQPYLFWVRRLDRNIVVDARPKAEIEDQKSSGGPGDDDLAQYYQDVLSTLAGGPYSGTFSTSSPRFYDEVEYAMCWIRPELFRGDSELKRKFPNGVQFETCNGVYIKDTAEARSMDECWTHYVYLPNAYSFWADGMIDCLPVQDQINETNSLTVRYLRYCTMSKKLYDKQMIDPDWLSNNPEEAWIPANLNIDKKLSDAVFAISPTQMSQDVGMWKRDMTERAMPKMSGAFAASIGESTGANASYSKQVFEAEKAQGRFKPMSDYNEPSVRAWVRQLLIQFRDNQDEKRTKQFMDNAGKWSFEEFSGADLKEGSFDIVIPQGDAMPQSKAEKARGLELYGQLQPLMATMTQDQKVYAMTLIGFPPEGNPETLQVQRAWRMIQRVIKGEMVTPLMFVDELSIEIPVLQQYLAGEDGERLAMENPEAYANVYTLLSSMQQMMMIQNAPKAGQGEGMPQGGPQKPPQGQGGSPKEPENAAGQTQEYASTNVPPAQRVPMPPLPSGARQSAQ